MVRSRLLTYVPVLMISGLVLLAGALVAAVALQADGGVPIPRSAADLDAPVSEGPDAGDPPASTSGVSDEAPTPGLSEAPSPDQPESPTPGQQRSRLVIHHVGDVNLDPSYVPVLRDGDPAAAWDGARGTFATADLVLGNLECAAATGGTPQEKQFVFRCDLDALPAMRDAGVDVVTLANNHSGDYGVRAMVESRTNVEAVGMDAVGVGTDEVDAYAPHIVEVGGWRVAIVAFGGVVPDPQWTARGDRPGQPTGYDAQRMAAAVRVAAADADVVVATVHWGEQGATEPRDEDRERAEAMVAAGADVVFGHHAHRLQPVETVQGAPVFWNLGNFVWPRFSLAGATTAVGEYVIGPDGDVTTCLLPFEVDIDGVPRPIESAERCR